MPRPKGYTVSEETRTKISETLTGRTLSEAHREAMSLVRRGRHKTDNPGYWGVHARLRRERGSASNYECVTCTAPARTWAYKEPTGFSSNLEDYRPMCSSCHILQDQPRRRRES